MSKFLNFYEVPTTTKTKKYFIRSTKDGSLLGQIQWFVKWKRYCFYPAANTIFDSKCLSDINAFIQKIK